MSIFTSSGVQVYISSTATAPATYDAAGYGALTFTQVNSVEDAGAIGDTANEVTFDDLAKRRTQTLKGQFKGETLSLVCGYDDADAGQLLLVTAAADPVQQDWHFKVVLPNKLATAGQNAIVYFSGRVMSSKRTISTANNVVKLEATVQPNTAIVYVQATAS